VTLTPHIGSATEDTRQAMAVATLENVRLLFATGRPATAVNNPMPSAVLTGRS
jgi:lactate dehydrogenase-like 2-hydroxyacid dehydrogenase